METAALQSSPRHAAPLAPACGEVVLGDRFIGSRLPPPSRGVMEDQLLPATKVIAEIEGHRARGARVLLLVLDNAGGGDVRESFAVYHALRRFSAEGGTVVVHVRGNVSSTGALLVLAGDYITIEAGGCVVVHSCAIGDLPDHGSNALLLAEFADRAPFTPRAALQDWLSLSYLWSLPGPTNAGLYAKVAIEGGWADLIGDVDLARRLAAAVADGQRPQTRRAMALAAKGAQAGDGYRPNMKDPINGLTGVTGGQLAYGTVDSPQLTDGAVDGTKVAAPSWVTPTFVGTWVGMSMGYAKDVRGWVTFKGNVRASGPGSTGIMFVLPAGFRPGADGYYSAATSAGGTTSLYVNSSTGEVSTPATVPASSYISLSGIGFLAEL